MVNILPTKTPMLRLDLFDYSDAYIVAKEEINAIDNNDDSRGNKKLTLKNNATFRSCTAKINNTFIDNAKHTDIVMPMYNLLGHWEVCGIIRKIKGMRC